MDPRKWRERGWPTTSYRTTREDDDDGVKHCLIVIATSTIINTPLALGRYQRVAMNASDLAKEVVAFNALRDRPSRLALVVHNGYGPTCTPALTILAPIENGRQILRVIFPESNARGRVTVDYDRDDLEAVAVLTESKMNYRNDKITLLENMEFISMDNRLTDWSFYRYYSGDGKPSLDVKIQEIKLILSTLISIVNDTYPYPGKELFDDNYISFRLSGIKNIDDNLINDINPITLIPS